MQAPHRTQLMELSSNSRQAVARNRAFSAEKLSTLTCCGVRMTSHHWPFRPFVGLARGVEHVGGSHSPHSTSAAAQASSKWGYTGAENPFPTATETALRCTPHTNKWRVAFRQNEGLFKSAHSQEKETCSKFTHLHRIPLAAARPICAG
jgi:hypothetical protein